MEILRRRRDRHASETQLVPGDAEILHRTLFGGVDAGKADERLRVAADVIGDELVGDLGPKLAALEAEDDRLVVLAALCPVMLRVGGGDLSPDRASGGVDARRARPRQARLLAQIDLSQLIRRLPDMCVAVNDHKILLPKRLDGIGRTAQ